MRYLRKSKLADSSHGSHFWHRQLGRISSRYDECRPVATTDNIFFFLVLIYNNSLKFNHSQNDNK